MSLPKFFALFLIVLFGLIGLIALFKEPPVQLATDAPLTQPLEIELDAEIQTITPASVSTIAQATEMPIAKHKPVTALPSADLVSRLFVKDDSRLPFVETIVYKSHVAWQKGRPAWLSDYASHYETSRHFIARSLNGKPDYFKQDIAEGDRFNVFRKDKKIAFHLVVDTSLCRMWLYCLEGDNKQSTLLKTYDVGLGRVEASKASGLLTPLGTYTLGDRIAIFKPKAMATHQGKKTEMMTVFGTRWIPFEKEIGTCTAPAKGFGIHGTPWRRLGETICDDASSIGHYESDGCIRLATPDIEELFSIIITKPTTIELVHDFTDSSVANIKH